MMATRNVALNIILGSVNNMRPGLQSANAQVAKLKDTAASVRTEFNEMYGEMANLSQRVGAALTGISVGFAVIGKSALSASMEMEGYSAKLEVAMKDSTKAKEMLEWAKTFAAKTPFEMSGVVDATTRLQLYGLEAKHWLPLIGDMAGAMGKDVTQGVEAIADAVSGGGLERLKEFGISSTKLKDAGWTGSYQTAEGINSLKTALETIMGRDFGGGMAKMMNTATGAMSNFKDAIFQLRTAIGDALLPTFRQVVGFLTRLASLISTATKEHPLLTGVVVKLGAAFGILAGVLGPLLMILPGVATAWNTLSAAQLRNAAAAAEAAAANEAAGAGAAAGGAGAAAGAGARGGILGGLARLGGPIMRLLAPIGAALAPIGTMLTAAWAAVLPVLTAIGAAIAGVGAAIAALPVGTIALIVAAIAALGIGIWQLVKHWDAVTAWFKSLPATIGGALGSIGGFFSELGSSVAAGISGAVGSVAEFVTGIPSAVAGGIATAWEAVKSFFAQLPHMAGQAIGLTLGVILWLPTGIKLAAQKIGEGVAAIGAFLASLPAAVASAAQKIGAGFVSIGQWFATLPGLVGGAVMQAWQWLKSLPQMALSAAGALAQSIGEGVQTAWQWLASLPGKAWAAGSEMVRSLGEWFGSLPQRVANWFGGVWDYLKSLPKQWYDSGVAMVQELINGVKSKWGEFVQGIKDGLQRAADMLPHSDPKTGPLKGLQKSGRALAEEFSKGANDGFHRGVLTPGLNTVAGGLNTVIANGASGGTSVDARSNYNITVHAAAGANGQEIGKQIVSELRKVGRDGRFSYAANAGY